MASTCRAEVGDVFIAPMAIIINEFCIASSEFNAVVLPPAYTDAPYSITGRTNALYKRSNVVRSAPHGIPVRHLNKLSLELHLFLMCFTCCCMDNLLSRMTPRNLNLVTYGIALL